MVYLQLILVCFFATEASLIRATNIDEEITVQSIFSLREILLGDENGHHGRKGCTGVVIEDLGCKFMKKNQMGEHKEQIW